MRYPEILTTISGQKVTGTEIWENYRRNEILTVFHNFVYGISPVNKPLDLKFQVQIKERDQGIIQKIVTISFCDYSFKANVFVPKNSKKPLPAYFLIMHQFEEINYNLEEGLDFDIIPIPDIINRGYAVVIMTTSGIITDFFEKDKFHEGVFSVFNYEHKENSWGIISAWAWGTSRVMDYLEADEDIDETKVIITGHSRSGKTALWSAALDKRFAMAVSNDSGCGGAAVTRGKTGEHIKDINGMTDWFCLNYQKYNDNEDMLPVDQHMLLSLIAPRPLYVASSSKDEWADPKSELLSCRLASEVYELYGKKGVVISDEAIEDTAYHEGYIGYHMKTGEHCLNKFDWNMFLNFSDKYIKGK